MGVLYLSVELTLDLITCLVGGILMFRARDNSPKFWWGGIALAIGMVFAWENIGWLLIVTRTPEYRFTNLLNLEKMLKWYPMAAMVALFPLASLFPGYLTWRRTLSYLSPSLLVTSLGVGYLVLNGYQTPLHESADVLRSMDCPDVILRCAVFLLSIFTPLFFFLYPLFRKQGYRRVNGMMYVFIGFMLVFLCIYILFTLDISYFIFNLFGATAIVFSLFFSLQYLCYENPFSVYSPLGAIGKGTCRTGAPLPLFYKIEDFFRERPECVGLHYTLRQLAEDLREPGNLLSEAVKSAGYSSFREYMTDLKLERFCRMAIEQPEKNIKELIFLSGFNSRATFYRNFAEKYGESPLQFLEKQRKVT